MGFHIPDSPPQRSVSASSQTTADASTDASDTVQFSERFSSRRVVRRRNAIIPTLSIDIVGSPRSPFVCLSRDSRLALSQQREQAQPSAFDATRISAGSGSGSSSDINSRDRTVKRAPGIRRRSDQRDDDTEASFASRASLNVHETP